LYAQSHPLDAGAKSVLYAEAAVLAAFRRQPAIAHVWQARALAFSLSDLALHRCACCVAWAKGSMAEARREWDLTREAGEKLEDKVIRGIFMQGWVRWFEEMNESASPPQNLATPRTPS
jgi:hypothetical protein